MTQHEHDTMSSTKTLTRAALPLTLVAVLAGCGGPGAEAEDTLDMAPDIICPGAALIGVLDDPSDDCELGGVLPEGWTVVRTFEGGNPNLANFGAAPGMLAAYCSYSPSFAAGPRDYHEVMASIDAAPQMRLESVGIDCSGQAPQAGINTDEVRVALGEAFRANLDWVGPEQLGTTQAARVPVGVAVIDTVSRAASDNAELMPHNEHGLQMTALIHDIACPNADQACIDGVFTTLALPREDWETRADWILGGEFGTQGDMAAAIYEAVAGWALAREMDPASTSPRLILNLSLGWERSDVDISDRQRGPASAVEAALQYASCHGVLVFVAAGNVLDEDCPDEGVLAPADLELTQAPSREQCEAMGFPAGDSAEYPVFGSDAYQPLVYAVGGVDEHDEPLINARPNGSPRLLALGSGAVSNSESHTALTGTSVSTAVTSAAAALLWSYRGDLRAHEVAALLYDSGWNLGRDADMVGAGADAQMHRLSVCAALDAACAGQPSSSCPQLGCDAAPAPGLTNFADYFSEVDAAVTASTVASFDLGAGETPVCDDDSELSLARPQPDVPVCPYCNVDVPPDGSAVVTMSIASEYVGTIASVKMIAYDELRSPSTFSFDAEVIASLNDAAVEVTTVSVDAPNVVSATLIFEIQGSDGTTSTQSNPLVVNR